MEPTAVDLGLLVLRLGVGLPFALHGFQKLFGWFGGGGLARTADWFASLGFGRGRAAAGTLEVENPSAIVAHTDPSEAGRVCRPTSVGLRRQLASVWHEVVRAQVSQELASWPQRHAMPG